MNMDGENCITIKKNSRIPRIVSSATAVAPPPRLNEHDAVVARTAMNFDSDKVPEKKRKGLPPSQENQIY